MGQLHGRGFFLIYAFVFTTRWSRYLQTLTRIEQLHGRGLIYRDVKPTNFVIGRDQTPEEDIVHLLDFGLSKEYKDPM